MPTYFTNKTRNSAKNFPKFELLVPSIISSKYELCHKLVEEKELMACVCYTADGFLGISKPRTRGQGWVERPNTPRSLINKAKALSLCGIPTTQWFSRNNYTLGGVAVGIAAVSDCCSSTSRHTGCPGMLRLPRKIVNAIYYWGDSTK